MKKNKKRAVARRHTTQYHTSILTKTNNFFKEVIEAFAGASMIFVCCFLIPYLLYRLVS